MSAVSVRVRNAESARDGEDDVEVAGEECAVEVQGAVDIQGASKNKEKRRRQDCKCSHMVPPEKPPSPIPSPSRNFSIIR